MNRWDFIARLWDSEAYTRAEVCVLTAMLLLAGTTWTVTIGVGALARKSRHNRKTTRETLRGLERIGVITAMHSEGTHAAVYRLNLTQLAATALSEEASSTGHRVHPDKHQAHRYQLTQDEAADHLESLKRRLAEVEGLLADPQFEKKDPERYMRLLQQRDRMAEDEVPKLERFLGLYQKDA